MDLHHQLLFLYLVISRKVFSERRVLRHALALTVIEGFRDLDIFALPVLREKGVGLLELAEDL